MIGSFRSLPPKQGQLALVTIICIDCGGVQILRDPDDTTRTRRHLTRIGE